jgi:hypothetical protein
MTHWSIIDVSAPGTEERIIELALSAQQANQARKRLKDADQAVSLRITDTYHWVSVPVQPQPDRPVTWDVLRADGAKDRLAERAGDKLVQADMLRTAHGARSIRYDLDHRLASVWRHGHIQLGELWSCPHQSGTLRTRAKPAVTGSHPPKNRVFFGPEGGGGPGGGR